ncbi:MAG: extracellular solute-binding protein, partial [Nitrososphaera sp.]|nr:extracellular solute-binding protein [Nitrososphaera sp.]
MIKNSFSVVNIPSCVFCTALVLLTITNLISGCDSKKPTNSSKTAELRIWQTETDKGAVKRLNETIEEFKKTHPNVDVKLESVAWSSLSTKLSVAVQSNNEPDLTHLQPFMVASLSRRNLLLPINDVIKEIEQQNKDKILSSVRDLQLFNGNHYGIAYAVGTTGFAYRKDIAKKHKLAVPLNWKEYLAFVKKISDSTDGKMKVLLPGGDPFFVDQLFAELVANNSGILFDANTNRPMLRSKEVVETLEFFRKLAPYVDAGWRTQPYLDQFNRFARGEAGNVPVTYARAAKAIDTVLNETATNPSRVINPTDFALMPQPVGPSFKGKPLSIATIDCEPFVIFKSAQKRPAQDYGTNADLAKAFLKVFYRKDHYLPFVSEVPIHLTPIFQGMAA